MDHAPLMNFFGQKAPPLCLFLAGMVSEIYGSAGVPQFVSETFVRTLARSVIC